jgi:hypothetical protein
LWISQEWSFSEDCSLVIIRAFGRFSRLRLKSRFEHFFYGMDCKILVQVEELMENNEYETALMLVERSNSLEKAEKVIIVSL